MKWTVSDYIRHYWCWWRCETENSILHLSCLKLFSCLILFLRIYILNFYSVNYSCYLNISNSRNWLKNSTKLLLKMRVYKHVVKFSIIFLTTFWFWKYYWHWNIVNYLWNKCHCHVPHGRILLRVQVSKTKIKNCNCVMELVLRWWRLESRDCKKIQWL